MNSLSPRGQGPVLRSRMIVAGLTHGSKARVSIPHARMHSCTLGNNSGGVISELRFCNMGRLRVAEILATGDGGEIKASVVFDDAIDRALPRNHSRNVIDFSIHDAIVESNGRITITADEKTVIQVHERDWPGPKKIPVLV